MAAWTAGPEHDESLGVWQWVSSTRLVRREERDLARDHLAAALRAGHGTGGAFRLRVVAGPASTVRLSCASPVAARWATRALLPAWGPSSWRRCSIDAEVRESVIDWGWRFRSWPDRLRDESDRTTAVDQLVLAMSSLPSGVALDWSFRPAPASWTRPFATVDASEDRPPTEVRTRNYSAARRSVERPRGATVSNPVFWWSLISIVYPCTIGSSSAARSRVRSTIEGALRSSRGNGIRFTSGWARLPWGRRSFPIDVDELTAVLPLDPAAPELDLGGGPPGMDLPLGRTRLGNLVGPPVERDQGRHMAVLGETGMGKSATLVAVARRAIRMGGIVLLDPLGETARTFVAGLAPQDRARVLSVRPGSANLGINALEGIGGVGCDPVLSDRRLNDLVHALRRVRSGRYEAAYWGPRLEEMLTRALQAAAALPSGTLEDAHTLLSTGGRLRGVVPVEAMPFVRELADRVRERPDDAEGARRLLYEVVRSPVLRTMLCERHPTLHASDLVAPNGITVVTGEAATVGEPVARYLLAVYLAVVWSELLARDSRGKTFVLLDESQWFSHESLAEMLRLARRRNVHVVLATQSVGSLPPTVAEAVWTNVSDFVVFRGSPAEARELERATHGVAVEELLSLPRGHAAVLLGKGHSVSWLRIAGRPAGAAAGEPGADSELPPRESWVPEPSASESPRVATAAEVVSWIRSHVAGAGGTNRVRLSEVRRAVDPTGNALRGAGAILGRSGALRSSVREGGETIWVVEPDRIPPPDGRSDTSPSRTDADSPQPS